MSYRLDTIPQINELLVGSESTCRKELAKSLNLKHNVWKHNNGVTYHILKYDKEMLSRELVQTVGLLRSVIFKDDGKIVSFAPPKSLHTDTLKIEKDMDYFAEPFVEGTMINVFYEEETNSWEIATRSSVGGGNCFFMENGFKEENTFKYMFNEVCDNIGLRLEDLNKKYVYSFVMQHPRNRIVKIIKEMSLYLVEVYEIVDNNTVLTVPINKNELGYLKQFGIAENIVRTLERMPIVDDAGLNQCKEALASMNTPYDKVGLVVKNKNGDRYKFRNPTYEHVRQLRGNQPKLQYQYIHLRQTGNVAEYLQYYKEHKRPFIDFRNNIHDYTNQLFSNYIRCYIKKEKELKSFPAKFKTHMFAIHHELYLKILMPEKKYVNKEVVINYFNSLHPAKQMFALNHDTRKTFIDSVKNAEPDTADQSSDYSSLPSP